MVFLKKLNSYKGIVSTNYDNLKEAGKDTDSSKNKRRCPQVNFN